MISYLLFRFVELPGILLGKNIAKNYANLREGRRERNWDPVLRRFRGRDRAALKGGGK
jgi:hypothetical protein